METQVVNKQTASKTQNLSFVEYCDHLKEKPKEPFKDETPFEEFLIVLAHDTGKHKNSVRRWYLGTAKPSKLDKKAVAERMNTSVEIAFPTQL
nr:hypothetical protein [uncultured Draconibacterium sp.]